MNVAVGLMDGLGLDGDRCICVIPRHSPNSINHDKSGMVTKGISNLATDTFPSVLIENLSPLLPLDMYLLPLSSLNSFTQR